jgi:hypothetical protein
LEKAIPYKFSTAYFTVEAILDFSTGIIPNGDFIGRKSHGGTSPVIGNYIPIKIL